MNEPILQLTGVDGNAFNVLRLARQSAKKAGWTHEQIQEVMSKASSKDYNHMLCVLTDHFEIR